MPTNNLIIDYDARWKDIMHAFSEEFIEYFLPELYKDINLSIKIEFLEQELQKLVADEERKGKKIADKLLKVCLKNGESRFILVHVEIEGDAPSTYPREIYKYYYRIYDRYEIDITTLVIYIGEQVPAIYNVYERSSYGTEFYFKFNTYLVKDQNESNLLASSNTCALAVLANLYVLRSKNDYEKRYSFKKQLYELLAERKIGIQKFYNIMLFIRYLVQLPEELEKKLQTETNFTMAYQNQARLMFLNETIVELYGKTFDELLAENAEKERLLAEQQAENAEKERLLAEQQAEMERQHVEMEQQMLRMRDVLHIGAADIAMILNKPIEYVQSVLDKNQQ